MPKSPLFLKVEIDGRQQSFQVFEKMTLIPMHYANGKPTPTCVLDVRMIDFGGKPTPRVEFNVERLGGGTVQGLTSAATVKGVAE